MNVIDAVENPCRVAIAEVNTAVPATAIAQAPTHPVHRQQIEMRKVRRPQVKLDCKRRHRHHHRPHWHSHRPWST